jgi:hypothetical protein
MKKLERLKLRLKLWNKWRKQSHWSPWKKFLVLIGRKNCPTFGGMYVAEGFKEGMKNVGVTAKKMSADVAKLQKALKDKLNVVSPSNPGDHSLQMSFYDEVFGKEDTNE